MSQDVYRKLAQHLDKLPGGYPATESGVELKILEKLFTPAQAELAARLTLIPEETRVVARRAGRKDLAQLEQELLGMHREGLIIGIEVPGRNPLFMAAQFVVGIWEYHVNSLDVELIELMRQYMPDLFEPEHWAASPQLRVIPVGRSVDNDTPILAYEQVEEMVRQQKKILVAPCICRREHAMTGDPCGRPEEGCLVFGSGVYMYLSRGIGREIDQEECLAILKQADKDGRVLQPSNSKKLMNICTCCGCCCGVLRTLKTHPKPASVVSTPFRAILDSETCKACGVCVKRCQMDAITELEDGKVSLDQDRCIGCGLCVSTCPTKSLVLERKPDQEQPKVPSHMLDTYKNLLKARGKASDVSMAMMALKSKLDRFLALR